VSKIAQIACRSGALKSAIESWNKECRQDTDGRDYNQELDQCEGALKTKRGICGHAFVGLGAHDMALGPGAKAKKGASRRKIA